MLKIFNPDTKTEREYTTLAHMINCASEPKLSHEVIEPLEAALQGMDFILNCESHSIDPQDVRASDT